MEINHAKDFIYYTGIVTVILHCRGTLGCRRMECTGIKRGVVYGESDATGSEPMTDPVSVENWAATIYSLVGIDHKKTLIAPGNRPVKIVDGGNPIRDIII